MSTTTCEKCGTANPGNVKFCKQCGNQLPQTAVPPTPAYQPPVGRPPAAAAPVPPTQKRYGALRAISGFCKLMGYIFAGLNLLGVLGGFYWMFSESFLQGIGLIIGALVAATLAYIFWNIIAESIAVLLDIEENTRRTANFLSARNS